LSRCNIQGAEAMSHEISQTDISGIQLRESKTQPKVSHSREIGEAQIVQTIFGRAKVRIIRKHDKLRRAMWLTAVVGVAAISAFVWQGWYATQQPEPMQSAEPAPPASAAVHESASGFQPENIVSPSKPAAEVIEPSKPAPAEISKSLIGEKSAPQPQVVMKAAEKEAAKPVIAKPKPVATPAKPVAIHPKPVTDQPKQATAQPKPALAPAQSIAPQAETANKPQTPPVAAGNNALKTPTATPLTAKQILPKQPVAATIAATPAAKATAPASGPAAIPVLVAPLVKEDVSNPAPVADKQLAAPLNLQSK
jgi:hypothetical protein